MNKKVKMDIIEIAREMDRKGLVNMFEGNISVMDGDLMYITPSTCRKATLTPDMICVINKDGKQIDGSAKASSEVLMHRGIYMMRADVRSVIHCHPMTMTAHALCGKPIETDAYPELIGNYKKIPIIKYGRPGTVDVIRDIVSVIYDYNIVLLQNHGVLAFGKDVEQTFSIIEACEAMAKVLVCADSLGPIISLDPDEVKYLVDYQAPIVKQIDRSRKGKIDLNELLMKAR